MLALFLYTSTIYQFSEKLHIIFAVISMVSLVFCCLIFIINQRIQKQEAELVTLQAENQKNEINKKDKYYKSFSIFTTDNQLIKSNHYNKINSIINGFYIYIA